MTPLTPPAPTAGNSHPARPAAAGQPAPAAAPFTGKTRLVPFLVGAALLFAMAETRARPIAVAILVGAIIFQLTRAASKTP